MAVDAAARAVAPAGLEGDAPTAVGGLGGEERGLADHVRVLDPEAVEQRGALADGLDRPQPGGNRAGEPPVTADGAADEAADPPQAATRTREQERDETGRAGRSGGRASWARDDGEGSSVPGHETAGSRSCQCSWSAGGPVCPVPQGSTGTVCRPGSEPAVGLLVPRAASLACPNHPTPVKGDGGSNVPNQRDNPDLPDVAIAGGGARLGASPLVSESSASRPPGRTARPSTARPSRSEEQGRDRGIAAAGPRGGIDNVRGRELHLEALDLRCGIAVAVEARRHHAVGALDGARRHADVNTEGAVIAGGGGSERSLAVELSSTVEPGSHPSPHTWTVPPGITVSRSVRTWPCRGPDGDVGRRTDWATGSIRAAAGVRDWLGVLAGVGSATGSARRARSGPWRRSGSASGSRPSRWPPD